MKKWWYAALAFVAVVAFKLLGASGRKGKRLTVERDELILEGSGQAKAKAHQVGIKADKHQQNALDAAKAGQAALDKVGKDESMRDLLDTWRADRVQ